MKLNKRKEKKIFSKQFVTTELMKYGLRKKTLNGCLSLKLNNRKENKIFCKQFFTTEPTKYGLKFSVLSIIINEIKFFKECLSLKLNNKK